METERLNPELVLAAKRLIHPDEDYFLDNGRLCYRAGTGKPGLSSFSPLTSADDREALMLALMKEGWEFSYNDWPKHERFVAKKKSYAGGGEFCVHECINASFPVLLMKCVSAQTGIPMYTPPEASA
jgi:hypothetical protein